MRICCIINVWFDAVEMLPHCIKNMFGCGVDGIIIIWSEASNHGEIKQNYLWPALSLLTGGRAIPVHIFQREPQFRDPRNSETDKRNFGLERARELGYTHFLTCDQDEFYEPLEFKKQRDRFKNETDLKGLVCLCQTYFKSPKLTIGLDTTLVPFIHELQPGLKHEFNRNYQFAWIDGKIRIDPSRSMNITSGVERCDLVMHHMSYLRKDIEIKIRNSSARANLERSTVREDYINARVGYFCKFYNKVLIECDNKFNLPELGISQ